MAQIPTRPEIRPKVFKVVADHTEEKEEEIREYLVLRGNKLGMDDKAIEGMTPQLDAIVEPYSGKITIPEVVAQKTVGDLVDLTWGKIRKATAAG